MEAPTVDQYPGGLPMRFSYYFLVDCWWSQVWDTYVYQIICKCVIPTYPSKKALFGVKLFVAVTRDKSMETPVEMMGFSSDGWPTFPQPGLLVGLRNRPSVEWGFSRPYVSWCFRKTSVHFEWFNTKPDDFVPEKNWDIRCARSLPKNWWGKDYQFALNNDSSYFVSSYCWWKIMAN